MSAASSTSDLVRLGLHTVVAAFRLGACAWEVGCRLYNAQDSSEQYQSWTAALASGANSGDVVSRTVEKYGQSKVSDSMSAGVQVEGR